MTTDLGARFLTESGRYLTDEYLPKIRAAVQTLSDDDIWWRPNEVSNSIGNLLLHLAGNIRQWIVAGVGGAEDSRERAAEFAARDGMPKAEALAIVARTVTEAVATLAACPPDRLSVRVTIQGRALTVFEAVYHVVEHCAMHTGQILWVAKARSGADLGFYEDAGGLAVPRWPGAKPLSTKE